MAGNNNVFILFEEIKTALNGIKNKVEELSNVASQQLQNGNNKPDLSLIKEVVMETTKLQSEEIKGLLERKWKAYAQHSSLTLQQLDAIKKSQEEQGEEQELLQTLSKSDIFVTDDIVVHFHANRKEQSFNEYICQQIARLRRLGKIRTSETYTAALRSFSGFMNNKDILCNQLNADLLTEYEAYLKGRGNTPNTISFYMRILKAVYNRAVEAGIAEQRYPFKAVYTGVEKTLKRAISLRDIKRIKGLDLSLNPNLDFARDMFLLGFYTRGMSFIDMAYLRKKDLQNGILSYRRRKTGQQLFIKWEKCMQEILDKYPENGTEYLLPIITERGEDYRKQYTNGLHRVNHLLKKIGKLLDLPIPLTMYVGRHSWASIAKSRNVPISVISEGMGHDSENTTQIYLASLDTAVVDRANKKILDLL